MPDADFETSMQNSSQLVHFQCRTLAPINDTRVRVENGEDWVLVEIDVVRKAFKYLDPYTREDSGGYTANFQRWFASECANNPETQLINCKVLDTLVPKQGDGYNCGMFVLSCIECMAKGVQLSAQPFSGEFWQVVASCGSATIDGECITNAFMC